MCGLYGWVSSRGLPLDELVAGTASARHRGPDGEGYWFHTGSGTGRFTSDASSISGAANVALGHRRLAIFDLSAAGAQPMASPDRSQWLIFNGAIYNYLELRAELIEAGYRFITSTDTEVAMAAYLEWGTGCFERFNGMWAMAIVDLRRRVLVLSRDRFGIKPLYVAEAGGTLFFASEIKQLLASRRIKTVANAEAVVEYVDTGYQSDPQTMFAGVESFAAGCWSETPLERPARPMPTVFWRAPAVPRASRDINEVDQEFRALFDDAVRLQLRSDVPVGVCLSGGLDSSAIYGQARRFGDGKVADAFSAAFDAEPYDERPFIQRVLDNDGGNLHLAFPTAEAFLDDCERFIYQHDEPVGSLSQYAAWSVMARARRTGVKVLLVGQGADELFSGYWSAYYMFLRQRPFAAPFHLFGSILPGGNPALVTQLLPHLRQYLNRRRRSNRAVLSGAWRRIVGTRTDNWARRAQQLDPAGYRLAEIRDIHLPRLLKWDDRSSMAFGIEGRYPFLDHRLVDFALSIPPQLNFSRGWTKMMMRRTLGNVLPPAIQWRKSKNGFVTPQSEWLRTTLRPTLTEWVARPSEQLREIVDVARLQTLAYGLFQSNVHPMDERQFLLVRLFLLDRWLNRFDVALPSGSSSYRSESPHSGNASLRAVV